ncbi:succinate dehydrogenase iron-sulfur subunit [Blochmannia endosymbiont of Polyrhachis (Hedomyrma) turneri]|uniref:succinate dehydrogenase iron-sulfur subunit n=1 Tax=Blochmannia endosymbiont of Polyrhachis (Hedomyrma) turneri TaxID=1505596 RepID=UPI00061A7B67|nr:succinate dehydrogenase iron-sulfur subunit [Blochmannia endosymbiont of Polyrhachis (Hedomyrma) turneri]AKC59899.1 Succinate dehydrogenase iron-sulfur subunit [Blochmannia endosymbiont of Polyrhachis (Hedomyrma) turneri]
MRKITLSIYRYNPEINDQPYMQNYFFEFSKSSNMMLLDVLIELKNQDPTLSFRRSCREGVCGSDSMNINGKNGMACVTPLLTLCKNTNIIFVRPLPGLPVIRDLVVDMSPFYAQYEKIKPFLINNDKIKNTSHEYLQSPYERSKLDGLYECILCGCCSTFCPSFWWHPNKFIGPAGLLTAYRFLVDTRDTNSQERLKDLNDTFSVFRCHNIMNCVHVCPKGLNPNIAINKIKRMLLKYNFMNKN